MKFPTGLTVGIAASTAIFHRPALAHAFAERYELPAPVWLFILGGALTVSLTFLMVGLLARDGAYRYAAIRFEVARQIPAWSRLSLRVLGIAVLLVIVLAGLFGNANPNRNIAPTLVWIIWWVGFGYATMLVGNAWAALDPWRSIFEIFARPTAYRPWPKRVGAWPRLVLLLVFGWIELVFPFSAKPPVLAALVVAYSALAWSAMAVFGPQAWRDKGDPFYAVFDLLGRFAPLALEDGRLVARPYAARLLLRTAGVSTETAFLIVAMLAIVLFDGFQGSAHWTALEDWIHARNPKLGDAGWLTVHSFGLIGTWAAFLGLYLLACALVPPLIGDNRRTLDAARAFALSLVPIAVGYHVAHTFVYLLVQGQNAIALVSDPFGWDWNLFGTRNRAIDIAIIGAKTAWHVALVAIVVGHALSVYLAHAVAERLAGDRRRAFGCLIPMTILMVVYTIISLQILAEPLVRYSGPNETII